MSYQVRDKDLNKVHCEMKRLIELEKNERSPKTVRDAALNSYCAIIKTLQLLGLPQADVQSVSHEV